LAAAEGVRQLTLENCRINRGVRPTDTGAT
jgi:hypothetical protein